MWMLPLVLASNLVTAPAPDSALLDAFVAEAYAVAYARGKRLTPTPHVVIDTVSFAQASSALGMGAAPATNPPLDGARVTRGNRDTAIQCTVEKVRRCQVEGHAFLISVVRVDTSAAGIDAEIRVEWTDLRRSGASAIGHNVSRYSFARTSDGWVLRELTTIGMT